MKKFFYSSLITIIFISFCIFEYISKSSYQVLGINSASNIVIDLNRNKIEDSNETVCIPDLDVFSSNLSINQSELSKAISIDYSNSIKIGYLTDNFAKNELLGKKVKLKKYKSNNINCIFADLYINNNSYREKLIVSGYGIINKTPSKKFLENLDSAKKLELAVLNHRSNKYHTLDCEYGKTARDSVIIPLKLIQNDSLPCNFCHINRDKKNQNNNYPQVITSGNIRMFLTDSTTKLKPDGNCSSLVCKEFLSAINNSKTNIDIALYGWDIVEPVYKALQNAKERGVMIRMVYDLSEPAFYPETVKLIKLADKFNNDGLFSLMHNKFVIFDNQTVMTGSMNISKTGLSGFNTNSIFFIKSNELANIYKSEFEQMLNGKFSKNKTKTDTRTLLLKDTKITPLFSPKHKIITNNVIPLIENAKSYIYAPVFIITHDNLTKALINAKNRGVDIKIITDATNTKSTRSKVKLLRENGIKVKTENYAGKLHSKTIIIDDKYVIAGSMNFTNSGEKVNDENVLIIENYKLANFYKKFFEYYWNKIPDRYLQYNPSAEGKFSIGSCSDGVDNNYDGLIDMQDKHCSSN